MANHVKIATIGAFSPEMDTNSPPQQIVERMIEHWRGRIDQVLPDKPDLIVVPEACDCPENFLIKHKIPYYQQRKDQVMDFFAQLAKENNCYITYPAIRADGDKWRNSNVIFDRSGSVAGIYNKNHPVVSEITDEGIIPGEQETIIDCDFGRVGCAICFDLNFDQLLHKYVKAKPDLIIFSSMFHGAALVQGNWAYACRSYFVGAVCRLPSEIRNPYGEIVATNTNYRDWAVGSVNLDFCLAHYDGHWDKFIALKAKYGDGVNVYDPGLFGSVMISNETNEKTAEELAEEFEIELLDDYLARSLGYHA